MEKYDYTGFYVSFANALQYKVPEFTYDFGYGGEYEKEMSIYHQMKDYGYDVKFVGTKLHVNLKKKGVKK